MMCYDSGVKLSLGKTRVKKKQVEMMIGQNIITRKCCTASCMTLQTLHSMLLQAQE